MNIHAFISRYQRAIAEAGPDEDGAAAWTAYIRRILHDVSRSFDLYCCCEGEHEERLGRKREYLWDLTWYSTSGAELDLPAVVIEHENSHDHREFFADFWKVMAAFAPVRIMIGYSSASGIAARKDWIDHVVDRHGWMFPPHATDLIVLKAFGASPPEFLVRYPGERSFRQYAPPSKWEDLSGAPPRPR